MGVREQRAPLRQPVDVRCSRLGMALEATDPVVQIVHGHEEDVGPVAGSGRPRRERRQEDQDARE